eukprot:m.203303 g.203303  ORF g.203303 m.203303 type:complete len:111 (-) comp15760_c0_seq8:117-449(-)
MKKEDMFIKKARTNESLVEQTKVLVEQTKVLVKQTKNLGTNESFRGQRKSRTKGCFNCRKYLTDREKEILRKAGRLGVELPLQAALVPTTQQNNSERPSILAKKVQGGES